MNPTAAQDFDLWNGQRPLSERLIVQRRLVEAQELSMLVATEDVSAPTDWAFEEAHHTIVVHLAGNLQRMESVFSRGPSSAHLPQVGDIWKIPAGSRYAALARGDQVRFVEFRVPTELLGGGHLAASVGFKDPFLHQAAVRASALAERDDDMARMALHALMEALRYHFADIYLGNRQHQGAPLSEGLHRFSDRQRQRLVDYIAATMHEQITVDGLAALIGVPATRLAAGFKASFGTTPWQYVMRSRLAEAQRLLAQTNLSVTTISAATGFASPSHFTTAFGRLVGVSPRAYRQAQRLAGVRAADSD